MAMLRPGRSSRLKVSSVTRTMVARWSPWSTRHLMRLRFPKASGLYKTALRVLDYWRQLAFTVSGDWDWAKLRFGSKRARHIAPKRFSHAKRLSMISRNAFRFG